MKDSTLELIQPLLDVLRSNAALREVRATNFHLDGSDFLHFHGEDEAVVADVRLSRSFVRMPVSTPVEQSELLERIDECLESLESHRRGRERSGRRRREW
jgi:hypothetical protein